MNNKNFGKFAVFAALLFVAITFSSCNRGYGCPYELKSTVKVLLPIVK
jgi:hypothetical protein